MKKTNVFEVCQEYDEELANRGYHIKHREEESCYGLEYGFNHLRWMLNEIPKFLETPNKIEKAHRWLGFVQGVLYASGFYSIDEMKSHNRSGNEPSNLPIPSEQYYWFEGGVESINT